MADEAGGEAFFNPPPPGDSGASGGTPGKKKSQSAGSGSKVKKKKRTGETSSAGAGGVSGEGGGKVKKPINKDPTGVLAPTKIPRPLSGFNLAGRPGLLKEREDGQGIKTITKKVVRPMSNSTINTDSEWTFVINSHKNEFIRFFANSMTVSLYSTYPNPEYAAAGAAPKLRAERHSTRALSGAPTIFLDPSLMGTSFVKGVRVTINGVPVQSNNLVDPHLLQYVKCARMLNNRPEPFLATQAKILVGADRTKNSLAMKTGLRAFDHVAWDNNRAVRIPIFLDGIWPFDNKCRTVEAIDQEPEPSLYLPPDTRIEVTVELHRAKMAAVFHENCNDYTNYFGDANRNASAVATTFADVMLEYESCELSRREHEEVIKQYREGKVGNYDYDIVRSQHQTLDAGVAYCVRWFQIYPHCRLVYVMFLPNFATFHMPVTNKPLSGWSRFPRGCTSMSVEFAGVPNLITDHLINFGDNANNHEISKKIFYDYLISNRMFAGSFDDIFSAEPDSQSIVQLLPIDLRHLDSAKTERLTVEMNFATATHSPANTQILVLSVHSNGRAVCSADKDVHDWKWDFKIL